MMLPETIATLEISGSLTNIKSRGSKLLMWTEGKIPNNPTAKAKMKPIRSQSIQI